MKKLIIILLISTCANFAHGQNIIELTNFGIGRVGYPPCYDSCGELIKFYNPSIQDTLRQGIIDNHQPYTIWYDEITDEGEKIIKKILLQHKAKKHKKISIHFDSPMWEKGGLIAPLLTQAAALYFGYRWIKAKNTWYSYTDNHNQIYYYRDAALIKATGLYAATFQGATIGICISFQSDK